MSTSDYLAPSLERNIANFDQLIQNASKATLKPCHNPHPKGAQWWMEECTHLHTAARSTTLGPEHKKAFKALNVMLQAGR
jgi:hypothetical protein